MAAGAERRKIVFLATAWGSKYGGINAFNMDLVNATARLLDSNYDVVCVALNADAKQIGEAKQSNNVHLISLDIDEGYDVFSQHLAAQAWHKIGQTFAPSLQVDWWIGHDVISGFAANYLPEVSGQGKPAVIQHMSYIDYFTFKHDVAAKAEQKHQLQKSVFAGAHQRFAVGPLLHERLAEMVGRNDVTMLVPGLVPDVSAKAPTTFTAITFGRLDPENDRIKQSRLAVAAFASAIKLAEQDKDRPYLLRKNPRMYLIGIPVPGGPEEKSLKALAKSTAGQVINLLPLPYSQNRQELLDVLSKSSIALMLSWHEGFGLTGWEAISAGVPLIVSVQSGLYEFVKNELHGAGIGCLRPVTIKGDFGDDGDPDYTDETLREVCCHILECASDMATACQNAAMLKDLLTQRGYTWERTARTLADSLKLKCANSATSRRRGAAFNADTQRNSTRSNQQLESEVTRQAIYIDSLEQQLKDSKQREVARDGPSLKKHNRSTSEEFASFARRAVCYNQGDYVQYAFIASEFHKNLKDTLRESPNDIDRLKDLCAALMAFLNRNFDRVARENFRFIKQYFVGRHVVDPRICIKASSTIDDEEQIVEIIRDRRINYFSKYPLKANSGFTFVKNNGTYFLCNNIPQSVAHGGYINSRINVGAAIDYLSGTTRAKNRRASRSGGSNVSGGSAEYTPDKGWIDCWVTPRENGSSGAVEDPTSYYKSTLVVPMTLWNVNLDPLFRERIATRDVGRTIFGYLCFDHVEEEFFTEVDIDIGYIFADMLSLYFIARATYTELSHTFSKVQTLINPKT